MTQTIRTPVRTFDKNWWFALGLTALVAAALIAALLWEVKRKEDQTGPRASQAAFDLQVANVRAGKTKTIRLYSTVGTDNLLKQLKDVSGLEGLKLELTDVSDRGMGSVAALKGLRSLTIYGGPPSISDSGLARLKPLSKLETLKLINTQVTDEGLAVLKDFPRLRKLTLFHEKWRSATFTSAGLVHLEGLKNLEVLVLAGGWAVKDDIRRMRHALPNCAVGVRDDDS